MSRRNPLSVASAKAVLRSGLDRALLPYFAELRDDLRAAGAEAGAESAERPSLVSDMFHMTLHELRTIELEKVSPGAQRVLSVGASGRWYFDWFEAHYGKLVDHIGVEAFEPRPGDLPTYATWIESTADRFQGVPDASVDMVFAGQTTEHLWADELAGFLLESRRVLSPGGMLVADSPNRLITEQIGWSHGGHTVELSPDEWIELLGLAGFEPRRVRGAWLCRGPEGVLGLEEGLDDPATLVRRISCGADRPEDCFIWWIDAERIDGPADESQLRREVERLFDLHWNTRVSRGMWPGPGSPGPLLEPDDGPVEVTSLPMMLYAGRWRVEIEVTEGTLDDLDDLVVQLVAPGDVVIHEGAPTPSSSGSRAFEFEQPELQLAVSLRIIAGVPARPVRLQMPVGLHGDRA